ncbi:MAG: endolytic transglycosylase MltG [Bacteroidales bacterium]|nr:endolytic transglycosylase MltG [Bacteroidales bacterium]
MKKRKKRGCLTILVVLLILLLPLLYFVNHYYNQIFKPQEFGIQGKYTYIYIPTNSDFQAVEKILYDNNLIFNRQMFEWVAEQKNLSSHIHPGKYRIDRKMSLNRLINVLRAGEQEPVRLTINSHIRFVRQIAGIAGKKLETDSAAIMEKVYKRNFMEADGFNRYILISMFIPNTYEFNWNTSAEQFLDRMKKEYDKFWNERRLNKAKSLGLSPQEVISLASIVQMEVLRSDEKKRIAGVYINRLKKGMLLQADPTVIYANGDFSVRRVTREMTKVVSPYNTYNVTGLPPGPICVPAISTIDAVLNYEHHGYIYFCAKDDFSGYHSFAKTLSQHNLNARKYQRALNKRKIYK